MGFIDYYKILDVPKMASPDDIKKAYRKLARKYHPDLNPNNLESEQKFKEINEANEVLGHPENRKKYDQYGKDWKRADTINAETNRRRQSSDNKNQDYYGGSYSGEYSDFFESMFGGTRQQGRQMKFRGHDVNASLNLKLTDVFKTQKQTITVNGKNIRLTFPAGIENGQIIRVAGHGSPGANGGPNGDLYITFSIENNTKFKRDQSNLYITIEIDLYTSLLGGEIFVDTFESKVKLQVAPETQPGSMVKLKGQGFPVYKSDGEFGDLFITYQVKLPTGLSTEEKELFKKLKTIRSHGNK